jgi:hypothetical protein
MALTRKMLKGMGLTEEQADTIIDAHTETVDGLKEQLKAAEDKAKTADDLQKELDGLKANSGPDYKAKYEKEHSDFEAYKSEVTAKETKAAKEKAARAYFEAKNITGNNLAIALRGAKDEISSIELDDKGNIKDSKTLDALVDGEFASLVVKSSARGANTATPPGSKSSGTPMTRADVYARDDKGRFKLDASQRQDALAKIIQSEQKGV